MKKISIKKIAVFIATLKVLIFSAFLIKVYSYSPDIEKVVKVIEINKTQAK